MKIKYIVFLILWFAGIRVNAQDAGKARPAVMMESPSRLGFHETVELLTTTVTGKGWKLTATHDLQETMKKNGKEILPVKVMEVCNPALAYQILSKDVLREVSPMLPCRLSVYEKEDGRTYISRMNAEAMAAMIGGEAETTILRAFLEVEEIIGVAVK